MNGSPIKHVITSAQRKLLTDLVGQELRFVGSENLDPYSFAESMVISTKTANVKFACGLKVGDFEGFEDEYPIFRVERPTDLEIRKIEKLGNFNISQSGSKITGISLVREVTTCKQVGSLVWVLEADMGLVLHFGEAAISFVVVADYDIVCRLSFHAHFEASELPITRTLQESDLVASYEVARTLIPLAGEEDGI